MKVVAQLNHLHKLTIAIEKLALLETVLVHKQSAIAQLQEALAKAEKQLHEVDKQVDDVVADADEGHLLRRMFAGGSNVGTHKNQLEQQKLWSEHAEKFRKMFQYHVDRWVRAQESLETRLPEQLQ